MIPFLAHTQNEKQHSEPLIEHLQKTSVLSGKYAESFGEQNAGNWMGLFHDAGKASILFQEMLSGKEHHINHAAAGAALLYSQNPQIARAIYGHHDGLVWSILPDLKRSQQEPDSKDSQTGKRFAVSGKKQYCDTANFMHTIPNVPAEQPVLNPDAVSYYKALPEMLHTRMLLSCLCDADYTATASHYDSSVMDHTELHCVDGAQILDALTMFRQRIISQSDADQKLNEIRNAVYESCLHAAEQTPGLFTLTAPTGTGKTLALLAFAARHAAIYQKQRIIIVLPFLSIISQNAKIYREICGDILEAHSMASYGEEENVRMFAEQWNAPVIITTSIKFFESFFGSRPSDLRFLHNIANSVIVFDEAQSIPQELTGVTIETMRCLCESFRSTVLFSTATQPAFDVRKDVLYQPYEIVQSPASLYEQTHRVEVNWRLNPSTSFEQIAEEIAAQNSVCCVLNRKDHTQKLYELLRKLCQDDSCFHISTDMCKAHRDAVIQNITERLKTGQPCRLISTSCIEAGVDLDFAVMFRALGPLEALVQCAGRCNRNGRQSGRMTVFVPDEPKQYPTPGYRNAAEKVKLLLSRHPVDLCNPEHIREYYTELFSDANYDHDKPALIKAIDEHDFVETERQYRFIPQSGVNVLVPYQQEIALFDDLVAEVRTKGISRDWMRRAAPLTVTSYHEDKLKSLAEPCMMYHKGKAIVVPGWYILLADNCYDIATGLHFAEESSLDYLI